MLKRGIHLTACRLALSLFLVLLVPVGLWAHGDLLDQIEDATASIEHEPKNAQLYAMRAELYRLHQQYEEAFADLEIAKSLAPDLVVLDYLRAKLYIDLKYPKAARAALDDYIAQAPTAADGYWLRAHVLAGMELNALAIADYTQVIALSKTPQPEYFIERARLEQRPGGGGPDAAVKGLDEGIARLGAIVTLELAAIDVEVAAKQFDAALKRVDSLMAPAERKETWLEMRGTILQQAARQPEALAAYQAALEELAKASARSQATGMMQALKARLEQKIASLNPAAKNASAAPAALPQP